MYSASTRATAGDAPRRPRGRAFPAADAGAPAALSEESPRASALRQDERALCSMRPHPPLIRRCSGRRRA
eukprot:10372314-Lingulodinium_polyedra.AAC.1